MDESVEWMRLLCICVFFQFKTSVQLKRGCVDPLEQSNFQWLEKKLPKIS
jgi:hypothetical protein